MPLAWDYSGLASNYDKRPGYPAAAWTRLASRAGLQPGVPIADIGAGTGKLTRVLLEHGYRVTAIEPNVEMRRLGTMNTSDFVPTWVDATAEATGLPAACVQAARQPTIHGDRRCPP